jgi:hypothetical protein
VDHRHPVHVGVTGVSEPTYDELMQRLADHEEGAKATVAALIYTRLSGYLTGLEAAEEQEAAALADAYEALAEPRAHLAGLDKTVTAAEGKCVEWSHLLSDDDPDVRASARNHYDEWSAEVGKRRAIRDEAERGYPDLFEAEELAKRNMRYIQLQKESVKQQRLNPFGSDLGMATDEYKDLRRRQLGDVLLRGQRDNPEWDQAMAQLRTWCLHAGYRGEDLPDPGKVNAEAMTAAMANSADAVADPAPSARDLMKQDQVVAANAALQQSPSRIDDFRGPPPPREVPQRDYMQVPRVRDMLGG